MSRWKFFAALFAPFAAAQEPIIITPGLTTFGPPKPANGECPACHTKHVPEKNTGNETSNAYMKRCGFCSCLFVIECE